MSEPVTQLDSRFSDPDSTATDWATTRALLESAQLSWITTVRSDGRPHVTPLVMVWLDEAAHFCTGGEEQKAVNLRHNPNVILTTGCSTHDRGIDVMVEGRATRVTDPPTLDRLAAVWRSKWEGQWEFEPVEGGFDSEQGGLGLVYRVVPEKVLAFGKGNFSHTRHLFD